MAGLRASWGCSNDVFLSQIFVLASEQSVGCISNDRVEDEGWKASANVL